MRKLPTILTYGECRRLFEAIHNLRDKLIFQFMFYCGLRISEVFHLKTEDINIDRRILKVVQGKNNKDRYVAIPKEFAPYIRRYFKKYQLIEYLFESKRRKGRPLAFNCNRWGKALKKYCIFAGIQKWKQIHNHILRHSYATYLLDKGMDISIVSKLLGHEDIRTTMIYTHLATEMKIRAVDKAFL